MAVKDDNTLITKGDLKKFYNKIMTYGERVIAISNHIKQHILKNYKKFIPEGY